MKEWKILGIGLAVLLLLVSIAYGSWELKRWFNYKFGYESQVQAQIAPLEQRIAKLEARVKDLEARK